MTVTRWMDSTLGCGSLRIVPRRGAVLEEVAEVGVAEALEGEEEALEEEALGGEEEEAGSEVVEEEVCWL
jgi:hypothetical protein